LTRASIEKTLVRRGWIAPELGLARVPTAHALQVG
jgi:hypothetical protein